MEWIIAWILIGYLLGALAEGGPFQPKILIHIILWPLLVVVDILRAIFRRGK